MESVKDIHDALRERSTEVQTAVAELTEENEKAIREMEKGVEELQEWLEDKQKVMKGGVEKMRECQERFIKAFHGQDET